jgi:hypothetical protein
VRPAPRDGRKAVRGAYSIPKGEPDIIAVRLRDGEWQVALIECKSPKGKLSPDQEAWQAATGLPVALVRSPEDLEHFGFLDQDAA